MRLIMCERKDLEEPEVTIAYHEMTESVDKKVFVYCEKEVFRSNYKLYELEEMLSQAGFVRVSKSVLLNIEKLIGMKTLVNSKLEARLSNGESVCVSRKYLKDIKEKLLRRNGR